MSCLSSPFFLVGWSAVFSAFYIYAAARNKNMMLLSLWNLFALLSMGAGLWCIYPPLLLVGVGFMIWVDLNLVTHKT